MLHTLTKTTVAVATGDAWLRSMEWCRSMPLENIKPLFPIWGRLIEFSLSAFSGFVVLLSLRLSPSCHRITSLHLSFGLPVFQSPPTSIFHVLITTSIFCLSLSTCLTISFYFMSHFCYAVHYFFMYRTIIVFYTFQMDNNTFN